ncbi:MAG: 2-phospho-L-lactate guanylyltransferase [Steroidobacteraceae bacterium]
MIAIKRRAQCKSRLAEVLAPAQRLQLVRSMLDTVIAAARNARMVRQILIVSPERDRICADIPVLADTGGGLNGSLSAAHLTLQEFGCQEVVVLPADLPLVTAEDIDELVRSGRSGGFAIAPDAAGVGTNALYIRSPHPFWFRFGPESRRLHLEQALNMGLIPQVLQCPGLEFDVDSPDDVRNLQESVWRTRLQA